MGCIQSSTQNSTDPVTGKQTTKTNFGGSYPGNRRKPNAPYQPPPSAFSNGQATAHFVRYGGGNALVLQQGGMAQPQVGAQAVTGLNKPPEYIQVTLPDGVYGGQTIQVQAPSGALNEIVVPEGFGPGSTFTVEFADAAAPPPSSVGGGAVPPPRPAANMQPYVTNDNNNNNRTPAATAPVASAPAATTTGPAQDDGFASGFNNPNFTPTATASIGNNNNHDAYSQYPSAGDARPVYSAPPSYPSKPY
mmetsp:Transcript_16551/g.40302  ORF Transcript_16551/g.40302 Transcript_16551/m.40302 type:complete len:248 (+) Transcript_16551:194-937(+)|eukprot:CAMPEP_0113466800 /NCGR_PEP_ID=MMETSP0014_2-20120614/14467_1 /TAXON_ID=2857 /ORGANISM="Nitzschia sp." /LENGTH=247 /DNA_ID=CAMNT_0000359051 /DNA_START=88 /DNA_END=831 /DNA_ORIENTATION=- /assembly_acc=CAM_ASM_000159